MDICPVCDGEVVVSDGVYPIHYRSSLFRCEGSGQPVSTRVEALNEATRQSTDEVRALIGDEPVVEKPVRKAAPRKKAPPKK